MCEVVDQGENDRVRRGDHQLGATGREAQENTGRENKEENGHKKRAEPLHLYLELTFLAKRDSDN